MGTKTESVHAQKGTMQDVIARCLKKTEAQVCTKINRSMLAKKYSTFLLLNMLIGKPTFKINIVRDVHGIIVNSYCPFHARTVFV